MAVLKHHSDESAADQPAAIQLDPDQFTALLTGVVWLNETIQMRMIYICILI